MGEAALHLPWLSPCAASLLALTRAPEEGVWPALRTDPGAVLLLLRHTPADAPFLPTVLFDPAVLVAARAQVQADPAGQRFADWSRGELQPVYLASVAQAWLAHRLAAMTGKVDPELAWSAALVAPLGWLAWSAVLPQLIPPCLADIRRRPTETDSIQPRYFGLEHGALARRLHQRWGLPTWLAAVTGHLGLPVEAAVALGAEANLFAIVQLAVALIEERGAGLALLPETSSRPLLVRLGLVESETSLACQQALEVAANSAKQQAWRAPQEVQLLPELMRLAAENLRLRNEIDMERLQREVDVLSRAVQHQNASEARRLQQMKLAALAEFAAGASHEINNPLAVISGQAQYLLARETDLERRLPLQKIINQAQRIHSILGDLMHFARPAVPKKQTFQIADLLRDVQRALQGLAAERRVRLVCSEPAELVALHGDRAQLLRALTCLLRNGIEAAPVEGWAGVRVELAGPHLVRLLVEDNGPGPNPADSEHLFDPFFSGRRAGRGRGLGLPTAWKLAQLNGGDVYFASSRSGPTCVVLTVPRAEAAPMPASSPAFQAEGNGDGGINGCHAIT